MTALALLRALVFLRRMWREIVKANEIAQARLDLEKERLALDHPEWHRAGGKIPMTPKLFHRDVMKIEDMNARYRERHPFED